MPRKKLRLTRRQKIILCVTGGGTSSMMTMAQMQQTDQIQTEQTAMQMAAENQRATMERWKILQDTQARIFGIAQDVTLNKAKTQDAMFKKWDDYIRDGPGFTTEPAGGQPGGAGATAGGAAGLGAGAGDAAILGVLDILLGGGQKSAGQGKSTKDDMKAE